MGYFRVKTHIFKRTLTKAWFIYWSVNYLFNLVNFLQPYHLQRTYRWLSFTAYLSKARRYLNWGRTTWRLQGYIQILNTQPSINFLTFFLLIPLSSQLLRLNEFSVVLKKREREREKEYVLSFNLFVVEHKEWSTIYVHFYFLFLSRIYYKDALILSLRKNICSNIYWKNYSLTPQTANHFVSM